MAFLADKESYIFIISFEIGGDWLFNKLRSFRKS
jgi:hypothetical protein